MNAEQQYNEYGSIAINYETEVAPHITALGLTEHSKTKGKKLTIRTTKQQKEEEEERADSKTGRTVAEVINKKPTKKAVKEVVVVAEVAEPVVAELTFATIERLLLANLAPLNETVAQLKDKVAAVEARADDEDHAQKEARKGYYQVKDGDEELKRLRVLNADLRKEIEGKTKTNQQLQAQLEEDPNELTRLKNINTALRKENEGLTKTNKALKAQMEDPESEIARLRKINAQLRKDEAVAAKGRKNALARVKQLQALLDLSGIKYDANDADEE
jgi:chromosome segregation ATPase